MVSFFDLTRTSWESQTDLLMRLGLSDLQQRRNMGTVITRVQLPLVVEERLRIQKANCWLLLFLFQPLPSNWQRCLTATTDFVFVTMSLKRSDLGFMFLEKHLHHTDQESLFFPAVFCFVFFLSKWLMCKDTDEPASLPFLISAPSLFVFPLICVVGLSSTCWDHSTQCFWNVQ